MPITDQWHESVTASLGGKERQGKGILPNPWFYKMSEQIRRRDNVETRRLIGEKIEALSEPRFMTGTETSELMESLITMIGAKQILELGMYSGRSALHFLRAIVGIEGARVTSIDARPGHDREFFAREDISKHFRFIEGWTPAVVQQIKNEQFDFVFVDSAHDIDHTSKELEALKSVTHKGTMFCFHDVPEWQTPDNKSEPPVRSYLNGLVASGEFSGIMLPSPNQLDCEEQYGVGYDSRCNPGLAIFVKK